jgi:succinate dehydrogenase/fumarate reductase iron-sulfur protein
MARTVKFEIYRYDPDKDAKPYMQDLTVELQDTDKMLLDALQRIKSDVDDSLALRRSCREGVCGSDAMNINGKNGLACTTNLNELTQPIVLRPLPGLPVIRDLIVDMTQFFKQYDSIKPLPDQRFDPPEKERLQSRPSAKSSTACTSASCARAARRRARRSGGIRTSSSARPACCKPTASSPTAATKPPASAWTTWKTRTACSAATRS